MDWKIFVATLNYQIYWGVIIYGNRPFDVFGKNLIKKLPQTRELFVNKS